MDDDCKEHCLIKKQLHSDTHHVNINTICSAGPENLIFILPGKSHWADGHVKLTLVHLAAWLCSHSLGTFTVHTLTDQRFQIVVQVSDFLGCRLSQLSFRWNT